MHVDGVEKGKEEAVEVGETVTTPKRGRYKKIDRRPSSGPKAASNVPVGSKRSLSPSAAGSKEMKVDGVAEKAGLPRQPCEDQ